MQWPFRDNILLTTISRRTGAALTVLTISPTLIPDCSNSTALNTALAKASVCAGDSSVIANIWIIRALTEYIYIYNPSAVVLCVDAEMWHNAYVIVSGTAIDQCGLAASGLHGAALKCSIMTEL